MERKYNYLEKIIVLTTSQTQELGVAGSSGTILGYDLVDEEWIYSVDIDGKEEIFSINENSIQTTGKYDDKSKFYK
jgi:hypothetical protein